MRLKSGTTVVGAITFFVLMLSASGAFALDGYKDRKNVFGGLGAGGGIGFVNQEGDLAEEGPGLHLQGILGSGVSQRFLVGVEADWWSRTVDKSNNNEYGYYHTSIGALANFFLIDGDRGGLRLDGGAGFAYGICNGTFEGDECDWQELGLEAEVGAGYEFWFNGTMTGAVDVSYTHHFYSHSAFDTITGSFGFKWY